MNTQLNGTGFKATSENLTCHNNFQYNIGKVYKHSGPLVICESGFHLCKHLHYTFAFYNPRKSRFFVVSYDNSTGHCCEDNGHNGMCTPKVVTSTIRFDSEIKVEDPLEMNDTVNRYPTEHMVLYLKRYGSSQHAKEVVCLLLKAGADVHVNNDMALRNASYNGYTEIVKLLLEYGANVHTHDNEALRDASCYGHTEVVRLLLDHGADVHAYKDYALRDASESGYTDIVKLLLDAGADVHAEDEWALRRASVNRHTEVVRLLLEAGADVHAFDDYAMINI